MFYIILSKKLWIKMLEFYQRLYIADGIILLTSSLVELNDMSYVILLSGAPKYIIAKILLRMVILLRVRYSHINKEEI